MTKRTERIDTRAVRCICLMRNILGVLGDVQLNGLCTAHVDVHMTYEVIMRFRNTYLGIGEETNVSTIDGNLLALRHMVWRSRSYSVSYIPPSDGLLWIVQVGHYA